MFEGFRLLFPAFFQQLAWVFCGFCLDFTSMHLLPFLVAFSHEYNASNIPHSEDARHSLPRLRLGIRWKG